MYKLLRRLPPPIPLKFFWEEFTAAGKPPLHKKKEMRRDGTSP